MEQNNLNHVMIAELKELQQAVAILSDIQANVEYPQTDNIKKAKAAIVDRFLKEKLNLLPAQSQPDGKSSS
jgi:hypothetical protein